MPHLQDTAAGRGLISEITRSLAGQRQRFLDEHMAVRLNGLPRQLFMPDSRNRNDDCITRIQKCLVIVETLGAELAGDPRRALKIDVVNTDKLGSGRRSGLLGVIVSKNSGARDADF